MKSVEYKAYAKINLHLDVTGKRDDGFHDVSTVMQTVSLYDLVKVSENDKGSITLYCNNPEVPADERNLAFRAASLFESATGNTLCINIEIEKNIPMAAGLAGGSSDAAATLLALNELYGSPLSLSELCLLGARLGADVPFCIIGGGAYADGKGDKLHTFPALPTCTLLVACGGEGVSTPEAYGALDSVYHNFDSELYYKPKSISPLKTAMECRDIQGIAANLYNIFEQSVLPIRPVASNLRRIMLDCGAAGALMSGSGPSVFGIFTDNQALSTACDKIKKIGVTPHVCTPIAR